MLGFLGRRLDVNLSDSTIRASDLPEELVRAFLAGRGLNAWLLYQSTGGHTAPLGPENVLILSCGLLTGAGAPASSRLHVSAKSPLTGILGSSNVGGAFATGLHASGFQCLLIHGRAQRPVSLCIDHGAVEILDATCLWGQDTWETTDQLKRDLGNDSLCVMAIGPGGENLVPFACIMADRDHAAGRTGMGAVMGSKNLKAIAVRREEHPPRLEPVAREAVRSYLSAVRASPHYQTVSTYGGSGDIRWAHEKGILATRNYREAQFEGVDRIDGRTLQKYVTRLKSCPRCPVHCKADVFINRGEFKGLGGTRPEFETIIALGSKCGLSHTEALLGVSNLCSQLGIDTISTGSIIAFAMDLHDRGILRRETSDGLDLEWGNHRAMRTLIHQIVARKGLGGILSHGVGKAAPIIGRGAQRFAYHTKGLELTGYDPRALMGTALTYAVSTRGGDFTSVYPSAEYRWSPEKAMEEIGTPEAVNPASPKGKGVLVRRAMIASAALDGLGLCKIPVLTLMEGFDLKKEATLTKALTGWDIDADALLHTGERIATVERLFNLRSGGSPDDDTLPQTFIEEPIAKGPTEGCHVVLEPMVKDFYRAMGWDEAGYPSEEKLRDLDLVEVSRETSPHRAWDGTDR
jgi:aldehyde:ferredoxin oxidoreductase